MRCETCGHCFIRYGTRGSLPRFCDECLHERAAEQRFLANRKSNAKVREQNLLNKYNLTVEQYDALITLQDGLCAVCWQPLEFGRTAVDHDHATGEVRGILCFSCNVGLGSFKDSPEILSEAHAYLTGGGHGAR